VDAALDRLDGVGDFEDPARGFFRVGIRAIVAYFMLQLCLPCLRPASDCHDFIVG